MDTLRKRTLELLNYDPETGVFTWKVRRGCRPAGAEAGTLNHNGYIVITIDRKLHYAHRLAFLVSHGYFPEQVDHINLGRSDNRISNLRPATNQENQRNRDRRSNNTSGHKGVCWNKHNGKWQAQAQDANGKYKYLGLFTTVESASAAYDAYARNLHGEFYRQNPQ